MTNDELIIRQLIRRFMDGQTTVDEEQRIARWLREHPEAAKGDLAAYREMFAWFGEGMPRQAATPPRRHLHLLRIAAALVLIVAVTASLLFLHQQQASPTQPAPLAHVNTLPKDSLHSDEVKADTLSPKAIKPRPARKPRRLYYRHKFSPAPPATLLAQADTMALRGERLLNEQLAALDGDRLLMEALAQAAASEHEALQHADSVINSAGRYITALLLDEDPQDVDSDPQDNGGSDPSQADRQEVY